MSDQGAQPPAEGWLKKIEKMKEDCAMEVNNILKDSHRARLQQINLQRDWRSLRTAGPGGKNELGLTGDQLRKMASIEQDTRQLLALVRGGSFAGGSFAQGVPPENAALRKKTAANGQALILEVLTPEQREKLKELQGPPFDVSIFDPVVLLPLSATNYGRDPLETKFDQGVIDYVGTLLKEQDTNEDGSLDKSEWVKGKWSAANPPENSDLNKDGKLSREELCIRISKSRGIPIKGEQPEPKPDSSK
jgi:DNA-binding TFAR19-related protein (PDSD5 family)